jgi:hypothetical protein
MKKRAQSPDAYTFSLLLRGLSIHSEPEIVLPKALALYQSMCEPDARVPPREIHTNYLLRICSRAGDMKSLWQALHRMPESGPGAPSTTTYTILLHALTVHASSPKATLEWVTETVETGRQIWDDVVKQWEKGNLTMDAKFVFSMASLLLKSPRAQDWDAVFSLVEQTTGIRRLIPRPGTASRRSFLRHGVAPELRTREGIWKIRPDSDELFRKIDSKIARLAPASQQLATAILTACGKLGETAAATRYWKTFPNLQPGGLLPDLECTKSYLRILRQSKASATVTEVVRELTERESADWGLFRIAMSTCTRNFKSGPKVFDEATDLYNLRKEKISKVDLTFLDRYLSVIHMAIITTPGSTDLKSEAVQRHLNALLAMANDVARVIRSGSSGWTMDDGNVHAMRRKPPSGSLTREDKPRSNGFGKQGDADEPTVELAKRILGLFDKLINSGTIQPLVLATLKRTFSDHIRQAEHGDPFLRRRDHGGKATIPQSSSEGR